MFPSVAVLVPRDFANCASHGSMATLTADPMTDGTSVRCMAMTLRMSVAAGEGASCGSREQGGENGEQRNQTVAVGQRLG